MVRATSRFAVIFDMNGVLIDDMPYHRDSYLAFAARHGKALTAEEFDNEITGRKNSEVLEYLFKRPMAKEEIVRFEDEKESLYRELYREKRAVLPGLREFLESMCAAGIPLAIATSAPKENVDFILDGLDLRSYFRAVVDAGRVTKGKPDPEIYLLAAGELGMPPERCLVFEDAPLGVTAARRAGMTVIGVKTTQPASMLPGTVKTIDDFREMRVAEVEALMDDAAS